MRKPIIFIFLAALVLSGGALYYFSHPAVKLESEKKALPAPVSTLSQSSSQTPLAERTLTVKSELNLDVPFTSQAPSGNWDAVHEEACEEASLLMANRYFQAKKIDEPSDAEQGIQGIISWENQNLGFSESTSAEETARIAREMLGLKAQIISNPSVDDIKLALSENKLVLMPAAGRQLGNPFFKSPGPLYHMLVIKGYTHDKFITNDPGTRNGADYPYVYKTLLEANHDWNNGDVQNGASLMVAVWE